MHRPPTPLRRALPLAATLAVAALASASPAVASTAGVNAGTLIVTGGGEANDIRLTDCLGTCAHQVDLTDAAGVTATGGCVQLNATRVQCDGVAAVSVNLGDGNDVWQNDCCDNFAPTSQTIDAGAGDDSVIGSSRAPDTINGGPGNDSLNGDGGNDTMHGDDGNDTVLGGADNDNLFGDAGADTVRGEQNDDRVDGGAGTDTLSGDSTSVATTDGNDGITARDGEADSITCGLGADAVTADSIDVIETSECESVDASGGGSPPPPPPPPPAGVALVDPPARVKIATFLRRGLSFKVSFPDAGSAEASLYVTKKNAIKLGLGRRTTFLASDLADVPEPGTFPAKLKARRTYAGKLKRLKRVPAILRVSLTSAAGKETVDSAKVILTR
jgi:Ca2+-binding RTX toxin-like protein